MKICFIHDAKHYEEECDTHTLRTRRLPNCETSKLVNCVAEKATLSKMAPAHERWVNRQSYSID